MYTNPVTFSVGPYEPIETLASVYEYSPNYGGFPPACGIDGTQNCAYSSSSKTKPLYYAIEWPYPVTFDRIAITGIGSSNSMYAWNYRTWNAGTGSWNSPFFSASNQNADYVNDIFSEQTTTKLKLTLTSGEGKLEFNELWVYGRVSGATTTTTSTSTTSTTSSTTTTTSTSTTTTTSTTSTTQPQGTTTTSTTSSTTTTTTADCQWYSGNVCNQGYYVRGVAFGTQQIYCCLIDW